MAEHQQSRKRVFCPHCEDYIARSSYYQHKHLYYDDIQNIWLPQSGSTEQLQDVSFEFSPSPNPVGLSTLIEGTDMASCRVY